MSKIEIFDEDNSISIDDRYHDITLDFFPETKEFKSVAKVKDDVFYINELYEYKLSNNPIEVSIRLKERSSEPPLQYAVKDGVVLESELQKRSTFLGKDFMKGLEKDVEWNKIQLPGGYVQLFYILSLHPEIISKEEYKKFLRATDQRIKSGLSNIEKRLKEKDTTGLQIIEREYGKQIWYADAEKIPEKEVDKKFKYVEDTFYGPLFDEKKPEYCGISRYEFEGSLDVLSFISQLLNEKGTTPSNLGNEGHKKIWHSFGYAWTIVVNLITLWVVSAIYNSVSVSFETIVVSILILIYLSIQGFTMSYGKATIETAFSLDTEFKRIRRLLKNEPSKQETKEIQEARKKVDRTMIKMYINAVFLFIIYLIALVHLFGAL